MSASNTKREGPKNAAWKGGVRGWQPGKLGRDKDGLSWKVQRKLAWERDHYTCQDCSKHKPCWKPDVHHINPYRLSFSHALPNLKCLCRRCHKKAEARIKELWGGGSFGGNKRPAHRCGCGRHTQGGVCRVCARVALIRSCLSAVREGESQSRVSARFGVNFKTLSHWVQGRLPKFYLSVD